MRYGLGVDLGTSFTAAAVHSVDGTRMVPLSPQVTVPSVAYASPDGTLLTGTAAEAAARDGDLGRLATGFKRRVGDPTPLVLGGTPYSADALMAAQLRDVVEAVTRARGGPPETVVLTCPAVWGPYRREHFAEVPRLAGVRSCHVMTEPEAVAAHYSMERRLGEGEVVVVYDLGGGTFDTTVLRMGPRGLEILGTPEGIEHMGGMDFDETVLAGVDDRLDGAVSALDRSDPVAAAALAEIRALCVRAKEELSTEPDVTLTVPLPSGPRELVLTRLELNEMLRPSVLLTADAVRRTIASAGLRTADVSAILLAGGSARIPLVDQVVSAEFGRPVRTALHPKYTVALGGAATTQRVTATRVHTQAAPVPAKPRRRWRVPAVAAAIAVVAAAVTALVLVDRGDPRPAGTAGGRTTPPSTLEVYNDDGPVPPYTSFIASADNWAGVDIADGAVQTAISATPGDDGLRVTWAGGAPGQMYLQNPTATEDKQAYLDADGALVFDAVVHDGPASLVKVGVHCGYPCAAEVEATHLFRDLPRGRRTTVTIPLSCFKEKGLNMRAVNTPFLVYTTGAFDVTFSAVRWEPNAAGNPGATRCADLN
ncbi:Hsp70 family protein [Actinophytocola sp. KF-1]